MSSQILISHVGDFVSIPGKPDVCNVILWGQTDPGHIGEIEKCIKSLERYFHGVAVTLAALDEYNHKILCAEVEGKWVRVTPIQPIDKEAYRKDRLVEIRCIDIGIKQWVPLSCLRSIPLNEEVLRGEALAKKFVVSDVLISNNRSSKYRATQCLEMKVWNQIVNVESVPELSDCIRVYIEKNMLLAKVLVEGNMAIPAASYQDAITSARSRTTENHRFPHTKLDLEESQAMVTKVEGWERDGTFHFFIQRKSAKAEKTLKLVRELISKAERKPFSQPWHGIPCLFKSRDEELYRGVIDVRPQKGYTGPSVYFVDNGLTERYDPKRAFEMPCDLVKVEQLAFRVCLAGAANLQYFGKFADLFTERVLNQTLPCKVVNQRSREKLMYLFDCTTGRSIVESIMARNNILREPPSPPTILELRLQKYPQQPNVVGTTEALEVVHFVDPSKFYVQLNNNKRELDDLMDKLAASYRDSWSKHTIRFPEVGMLCVAQYSEDDAWYRAQIIRLIEDEKETVQVHFTDYAYHCKLSGLKEDVAWKSEDIDRFSTATMGIKSLSGSFDGVQNGVYKVRLMDNPGQGVASYINQDFGAYPRSNVPVPTANYSIIPIAHRTPRGVTVSCIHSFDRFYLAPDPDLTNDWAGLEDMHSFYNSLSPNELVEDSPRVGLPCVVEDDEQFFRSRIIDLNGQLATVVFVDFGFEQETPLKDLKRIIPSFLKIPQMAWECRLKDFRADSSLSCSELKVHEDACFLAEGDYQAVLYEPDSDGVYPVNLRVPKIGDAASYLLNLGVGHILPTVSEEVMVSYVETPNSFWIHKKDKFEAIHDMEKAIADIVKRSEFQGSPKVGDIYLAKYAPTTKWLRARLLKVEGPRAYAHFLEIGDIHWVDSSKEVLLCPLLFKRIPPFAEKCTFRSGINADSKSVELLREAFKNCTAGRVCHAVFSHQVGDVLEVESLCVPVGLNVAKHLAAVLDSPRSR